MHSFTKKLRQGDPLVGTVLSLGASAVSEVVSRCGFDWLWIDMEHAPLSLEQVQTILQAKSDQCHAFVRIPTADETWIKRVLDLGPDGIIVPNVKTADQARMVVAACKYPPAGVRSVGLSRASKFGMNFADYVRDANEQTIVILQIEHTEAVQDIDSILSVPNIDAIIIGPYDLSGSFGKLGQVEDAEVQAAMQVVQDACKKHSVPLGVFAMTPEHARNYLKQGYKLVAVGVDIHYLWTSAKNALESLKVKKTNPTQPTSVRS
jgi:2-keto-3-deoxy-L-rhamnonate aldolase RhmA